jgi:multidrug resistance protein, MATE family
MTHRNDLSSGLTRHAPASVRELLTISIPLMVASLSGLLMNFCDRLILAHYSTDAMNAAVVAGMAANIFSYGAVEIAIIAEVFVGRRNGAKDFLSAAAPAWQMIWFSLATSLVFIPCALFATPIFVSATAFSGQAVPYFKIWMMFAFLFPLAASLSAFFIGIGKVKIVTVAAIVSNVANVVLDYLLVFGISGVVEPMGIHGAVLATVIAQALQVSIFAAVFFAKHNRQRFATTRASFSWPLLKDCLNLGLPNAIGHMIEIAGWALIMRLLTAAGDAYVTVHAMGQNLLYLFAFISQGLQKGVIAIGSNLMGAKMPHLITKLIRSSLGVLVVVALLLFFPLVLFPEPIMGLFLSQENESQKRLFDMALKTGVWVWCFIIFDNVVWTMAGVLTVYGDTKFIMVANAFTAWCLAVMPIYVAVYILRAPPHYGWMIINVYALLNAFIFMWRVGHMRKFRP